ncbi:MAG: DUF3108 domain-containing protein [Deltaproteobacteria bacterium]|nr:DUF3108 domain-containing protein [Deltaproteobacteria bacterium]
MIRAFLIAVVGSSLLACGSSSPQSTGPTGPVAQAEFGAGTPLATPGERMTYRVQLRGMELATMQIAVGDLTALSGKQTIVVQVHAKSVGLASMVAAIDDTFTSWIDVTTGRSVRFAVDEYETNSKTNVEHTIADLIGRSGDQVPITFALNDAPPQPEPQKVTQADVWDYNAFLIALRSWEGAPGRSAQIEVLRSRYLWSMAVKIGGKEKLETELGELPALRFDAHTFKLTRAGAKDMTSDERDLSIWISDDNDRVPLKLVARTDYGDVKMEIVDYQPGTGTRLRP